MQGPPQYLFLNYRKQNIQTSMSIQGFAAVVSTDIFFFPLLSGYYSPFYRWRNSWGGFFNMGAAEEKRRKSIKFGQSRTDQSQDQTGSGLSN